MADRVRVARITETTKCTVNYVMCDLGTCAPMIRNAIQLGDGP